MTITLKGKGDLVGMNQAHYERLQNLLELYGKLGEAESPASADEKGNTRAEVMKKLKVRII